MHQQQAQADSAAAARKMAHPAASVLLLAGPRAGGGGGGGSGLEEPPSGAAGPPQSLSLSAAAAAAAAQQLKKKSGFQITSVTPAAAQLSASLSSNNNSLAEDTESYDDLDESHTEDLSSSEILDASLSRATDPLGGGPERSSSEETLSNCHEADTPGALSPNQPRALPPAHLNGSAPRKGAGPPDAAGPRAPWRPANPHPQPHPLPKAAAANGPALAPAPAAAPTTASRFRVVKLDSSSEPFRKGRWTCTEFYDKESLAADAAPPAAPHLKALEALRQAPLPDAAAAGPERESTTSGSSVSSTLSHYTESAGSGEMGAPDPASAPAQPGLPQSLSQPQLHQEAAYPPHGLAALPPPGSLPGQHQQPGIPAMLPPQQLPYATAPVAPQPQQPLAYGGGQATQVPGHVAPAHLKAANPNSLPAPDYMQHPQMLQPPVSSMQPGPALVGTGTPAPAAPAPNVQPSGPAHLAVAPTQPVACVQAPMPAAGAGIAMQGALPPVVQQPLAAGQMAQSMLPQNTAPSQVMPPLPSGMIPTGTSGLPQPLVLAPQTTLLSAQAQLPAGEPLGPGMAGQQVPAVSPGPTIGAVPGSGHCAANMPPPPVSLAPSKNIAPSSVVQNENLVQKLPHSSLTSAGINLPMPQNVPPLNSALFSAQSLAQSSAGRGEEARRSTDPLLVGITQPLGPESISGVPSALSDGASSMAASLFPLKGLPLTAQLMDGEDDG